MCTTGRVAAKLRLGVEFLLVVPCCEVSRIRPSLLKLLSRVPQAMAAKVCLCQQRGPAMMPRLIREHLGEMNLS